MLIITSVGIVTLLIITSVGFTLLMITSAGIVIHHHIFFYIKAIQRSPEKTVEINL